EPGELAPGPHGVTLGERGGLGRLATAVIDVPGARRRFRVELGAGIHTRPVVLLGKLLVGTDAGELVALDPGTGALAWRVATGGPVLAEPVLAGERIVLGSGDGRLRALAASGERAWERDLGAPI